MPAENPQEEEWISIRSEAVQDILTTPPAWLVRWGSLVVLIIILVTFLLAYYIPYPDVIPVKVTINAVQEPFHVKSPVQAQIRNLYVKEGAMVQKDDKIVSFDDRADLDDVLALEKSLKTVKSSFPQVNKSILPSNTNLGFLAEPYARFLQSIKGYQFDNSNSTSDSKVNALKDQILKITELNINLKAQREILEQELAVVKSTFDRQKQLLQEKIITINEYENAENQYLQYTRQIKGMETNIINNDIQIQQLQTQIVDLKNTRETSLFTSENQILKDIDALLAQIEEWKKTKVVLAPASGRVVFPLPLKINDLVSPLQELISIVPNDSTTKPIAKGFLSQQGFGLARLQQRITIQIDGYPYRDWGVLKGKLSKIAEVPVKDQGYAIEMELEGMTTSYGKTIAAKPEMTGSANIATEERSLVDRFLGKLMDVFQNR